LECGLDALEGLGRWFGWRGIDSDSDVRYLWVFVKLDSGSGGVVAAALRADALWHFHGQRFLPGEVVWRLIVISWVIVFWIQLRPFSSSPISL
jgi:hypothetical protein